MALVIIVWLSPGQSAFRYKPDELRGRAWPYETLNAPFDFAIQKSDEELTDEKTRIRESFTPYFRFDSAMADESEQHIAAQISGFEPNERTQIMELVDRAYMKGIRATVNVTNRGSEDEVLVLHGNITHCRG